MATVVTPLISSMGPADRLELILMALKGVDDLSATPYLAARFKNAVAALNSEDGPYTPAQKAQISMAYLRDVLNTTIGKGVAAKDRPIYYATEKTAIEQAQGGVVPI